MNRIRINGRLNRRTVYNIGFDVGACFGWFYGTRLWDFFDRTELNLPEQLVVGLFLYALFKFLTMLVVNAFDNQHQHDWE